MNTKLLIDEYNAETAEALRQLQEQINRMNAYQPKPTTRLDRLTRWVHNHPLPSWLIISVLAGVAWLILVVMP
jgi:hypothetical protein